MMKYRALFTDPDDGTGERPDQILGNTWGDIEAWANKKLATGGPDSFVRIYETAETLMKVKHKPKEQPA